MLPPKTDRLAIFFSWEPALQGFKNRILPCLPGLSPCKSMIPICWKPWMWNCPTLRSNPGWNDFYEGFQVKMMEKLNIEIHPKLRRKIHVPKKSIIPNSPLINLQQQKIIKVCRHHFSLVEWKLPVARTRSRCFCVVGTRFVFGSPRVTVALEQVQHRGGWGFRL